MTTKLTALTITLLILLTGTATAAAPDYGPRQMRMTLAAGGSTARHLCATSHGGNAVITLTAANRPRPVLRARQVEIEGGSVPLGTFRRVGDRIEIGLLARTACVTVRFKAPAALAAVVTFKVDRG